MKKINKDLLKLKIKISCKNNLAYQDVAYLVDKPEFLRLLPEIRDKYAIKKLIPLSKYTDWLEKLVRKAPNEFDEKKECIKSIKRLYKIQTIDFEKRFLNLLTYERFDWEAKLLTRKFKRPGYFSLIIKQAIVCGEVDDNAWESTYADVIPWELPSSNDSTPELVIVISPQTQLKDVERVFKEDIPRVYEDNKHLLKYAWRSKEPAPKTKTHRAWYWKRIEGMEDREIYDYFDFEEDVMKVMEKIKLDAIRNGIKDYEKNLKTL